MKLHLTKFGAGDRLKIFYNFHSHSLQQKVEFLTTTSQDPGLHVISHQPCLNYFEHKLGTFNLNQVLLFYVLHTLLCTFISLYRNNSPQLRQIRKLNCSFEKLSISSQPSYLTPIFKL